MDSIPSCSHTLAWHMHLYKDDPHLGVFDHSDQLKWLTYGQEIHIDVINDVFTQIFHQGE